MGIADKIKAAASYFVNNLDKITAVLGVILPNLKTRLNDGDVAAVHALATEIDELAVVLHEYAEGLRHVTSPASAGGEDIDLSEYGVLAKINVKVGKELDDILSRVKSL